MARRPLESNGRQKDAKKHNFSSISERWQDDERYRTSELADNCTEVYGRYLDYLTTIDMSHEASYHQRNRYENTSTMQCHDQNLQYDYRATTEALVTLGEEHGRTNTYIPNKDQTRQRSTLDPKIQQYLVWRSQQWRTHFTSTTTSSSSSSSWSQNWWEDTQWRDTSWRDRWYDHQWQDHQ